ncbi:MAG: TldD/PmbA family protein [Rikenellaceae bacterium]|nr:TldD/PmbA family protein [Rikenellaceae bacterium]
MIFSKEYYLDTFKVTEDEMRRLAAEGLRKGGDFCDLFFENTSFRNLLLRDGQVTGGGFHIDYGVGIRVLKGERTGYAYSESTDYPSMKLAAEAAATIALTGKDGDNGAAFANGELVEGQIAKLIRDAKDRAAAYTPSENNGCRPVRRFFQGKPNPSADRYPMIEDWRDADTAKLLPCLNRLDTSIRAKDSRVVKVIAMITASVTDVLMFNSFEELKYDTRPMGSIVATVIFSQNGAMENKSVSRSFRMGVEMITDEIIEEIAAQAVEGIDERFDARKPKGGQMPVVMGAGASGILLHEAMGHAFEADFNRKGQSIFSDKMGCRICPSGINIIDDGTVSGNRGAVNFDDEGVPGQKTYMVEDGILTSYLHDRISAKWYGVTATGNGRRESFRYNPIPRMRATYMESGNADKESIIASVSKGIYVDEFSNGQVKIGEGDFTFFVKSGFLIENGRLTAPVKDINIIGNGPQALADIAAVANDLKLDNGTWTCGKEQSVPVCCGIPTVLINNLTVGGE